MKTYWLILSVFLFYYDLAVFALSIDANQGDGQEWDKRDFGAIDSFGNIPADMDPDIINSAVFINENSCSEWEVYDGTECVCADMTTSKCAGEIGMVCDDIGQKYDSLCDFANDMCHGRLPVDRKIVSCGKRMTFKFILPRVQFAGVCDVLKLVHEEEEDKPAEGLVNEEFELQDPKNRTHLVYVSTISHTMIFFEKTMNRWVLGEMRNNEPYIGLIQKEYSKFPQDHQAAFLTATENETGVAWDIHPTLTVKCVNRMPGTGSLIKNKPTKRFIFFLIALAITVATTAYVLKKVQEARGCLYYPSVCSLRDELKNDLGPKVKALKNNFKTTYGDIEPFKNEAEQFGDVVLNIKAQLVTVKDLQVGLDTGIRNLTKIIQDMNDRFPDLMNALDGYNKWMKSMKDGDLIRKISFDLTILTTAAVIPSLMEASVGLFTLAGAALGAVATIAFGIVDIVSSIREERKVRNDLEDAKSTYLKAQSDLLNAFTKMTTFQKEFCKIPINFLQQVSKAGKNYHPLFKNLYQTILNIYGSSPETCDNKVIYRKSSKSVIESLRVEHLQPLKDYLTNNIDELKKKIEDVKEMQQFLNNINMRIRHDRVDPTDLFDSIKHTKPVLAEKQFKHLYDLLVFISMKSLPTESCYWGVNLAGIRSGTIDKNNYLRSPICKSSEPRMVSAHNLIKEKVSQTEIPCDIFDSVKGHVFRTRYLLIWYIADYILPGESCYWGINLVDAKTMDTNELDEAKLSTSIFSVLDMMANSEINSKSVSTVRWILCGQYNICTEKWQIFLMCAGWKNADYGSLLACSDKSTGSQCVPPPIPVTSCSSEYTTY